MEGFNEVRGIFEVGCGFPGIFGMRVATPFNLVMELAVAAFGIEDLLNLPFEFVFDDDGRWRRLHAVRNGRSFIWFEKRYVEDEMFFMRGGRSRR